MWVLWRGVVVANDVAEMISVEPDWVGLATFYEQCLVEGMRDYLVNGADARKWVDNAIEVIMYVRSIKGSE